MFNISDAYKHLAILSLRYTNHAGMHCSIFVARTIIIIYLKTNIKMKNYEMFFKLNNYLLC